MGGSCWRGGQLRPQFPDQPQNLLEHLPWNGDLGHLEDEIATVADDLRADLDQLLLQARQRPVLDRLGRRQRAEEVAEIVGEEGSPIRWSNLVPHKRAEEGLARHRLPRIKHEHGGGPPRRQLRSDRADGGIRAADVGCSVMLRFRPAPPCRLSRKRSDPASFFGWALSIIARAGKCLRLWNRCAIDTLVHAAPQHARAGR